MDTNEKETLNPKTIKEDSKKIPEGVEEEQPKIAAIIDNHRIAIKVSQEFIDYYSIEKGDKALIATKTLDIPDPDDSQKILGQYKSYKDEFEVTSLENGFVVATKYNVTSSFPQLSIFGSQKTLAEFDHSSFDELLTSGDIPVAAGDNVDFYSPTTAD